MNFTVDWDKSTENDLMELWLAASDQRAITAATAAVDQLLSEDPFSFGLHLSEGLWRIRVPPLVVHDTIDTALRHVQVTAASRTTTS